MTGLILQKGVPLTFRNDEASEFVKSLSWHQPDYDSLSQPTLKRNCRALHATLERVSNKM